MRPSLIAAALLLLVALWATMTDAGRALTGSWSFTKWARVDRGTYFRLKVDVTYRGEPQRFDIVVGCNALDIAYKDGSSTREVGLVPTVYGRRMKDGKGLVVRVPDACDGETTANGKVPAEFIPVMVVFDDAETLGFGTAYMADEAYDSPRSLMKFGRATVEKATRAEFVTFRKDGPLNLVTHEQYHSAQPSDIVAKMGLKKVYPAFGRSCWSYARALIPEEARPLVRKYWPANRPKYWIIPEYQTLAELREQLIAFKFTRDDGWSPKLKGGGWPGSEQPSYGALHRKGSILIGGAFGRSYAPSFYPVSTDIMEARWPRDPSLWADYVASLTRPNFLNIEVAGTANRGFAYCYQSPISFPLPAWFGILNSKERTFTVDGIPIAGMKKPWTAFLEPSMNIFEDDKFMFGFHNFYLESTRGDV